MAEKQNIDERVDEKIDIKIEAAHLPDIRTHRSLDTAENIASRTTIEQDLRTAGQREINLIWEQTQKRIAMFVVLVANLVSAIVVIRGVLFVESVDAASAGLVLAAFTLLSSSCFLVLGFYFSRTNHARIGDDPARKSSSGGMDDR